MCSNLVQTRLAPLLFAAALAVTPGNAQAALKVVATTSEYAALATAIGGGGACTWNSCSLVRQRSGSRPSIGGMRGRLPVQSRMKRVVSTRGACPGVCSATSLGPVL